MGRAGAREAFADVVVRAGSILQKLAPQTGRLRPVGDPGIPLTVSGQAFHERGEEIQSATIEIWQTDHLGHYDIEGYRYRAQLLSDEAGKCAFETVMIAFRPLRTS